MILLLLPMVDTSMLQLNQKYIDYLCKDVQDFKDASKEGHGYDLLQVYVHCRSP